jgi:phosphoribosylformylglycinamidine cyclo-ligase
MTASEGFTYAQAGVSLDAAEAIVGRLASAVRSTRTDGVVEAHGGFAGLFALGDDLLVSGTDGVGTKLLLHREAGTLHAAGIDCVGMCVNDVLVTGARPLFFLDYVAVGRLDPERVATIVEGIADGCRQAGAALLGGETAEHPGVMGDDDLDVAGFAVGIVRRDRLVDGARVQVGDAIVGIASSGVHSNGFSLVRTLLAHHGIALADAHPDLLAPTIIYAREVAALVDAVDVRAMAHVTGGGIEGNLPRVLPAGAGARIDRASWPEPGVFGWIAGLGVAESEMLRVFNCGIGYLAVVPPADIAAALAALHALGREAWHVGTVTAEAGILFER